MYGYSPGSPEAGVKEMNTCLVLVVLPEVIHITHLLSEKSY